MPSSHSASPSENNQYPAPSSEMSLRLSIGIYLPSLPYYALLVQASAVTGMAASLIISSMSTEFSSSGKRRTVYVFVAYFILFTPIAIITLQSLILPLIVTLYAAMSASWLSENAYFSEEEGWRKMLQSLVPANGISVLHIRTGEPLALSRRNVLFNYSDCRLELSGNNYAALWPGDGKPGLWMNSISRMGAIYTLLVREEEIFIGERKRIGHYGLSLDRDENIELFLRIALGFLDAGEQIVARDLYWGAICDECKVGLQMERAEEMLVRCVEKPFCGRALLGVGPALSKLREV
ncbi:hypothetical protein RJ639_030522 [Escallonia herrerae]|uniref:Uncharacterized protein n=1 Tax=Escallonia herrerae TaxID=1293975 RepID=A0AA89BD90_9ASTE|nr:hypothetical protein RJ639_030522 [Escallonia herrerae]